MWIIIYSNKHLNLTEKIITTGDKSLVTALWSVILSIEKDKHLNFTYKYNQHPGLWLWNREVQQTTKNI